MTPSPVLPSDAKAVISDPNSSLCDNFIRTLLRLPVLFYQFLNWLLDANGNVSEAFRQQVQKPGDLIFSAAPLSEDNSRLLCNGQEVSQTTFPGLYAAIKDVYGDAGPGNFKLPDFRARSPMAVGILVDSGTEVGLGDSIGEELHKLTVDELAKHRHQVNFKIDPQSGDATQCLVGAGTQREVDTDDAGGDSPHNTVHPCFGCFVYIST